MKRFLALLVILWSSASFSFAQAEHAGPTISGKVTILDYKGKPKSDHSGVVVFLDNLPASSPSAAQPAAPRMRQINKSFDPKVLPIAVGTTVEFPNDDNVFHNVFSLSKTKPFDLGIYAQNSSKSVVFDQPGLVKVYCNIHPQMIGYILVLANPYFTTTDEDGHFILENAPVGLATIRTWYPSSKNGPEKHIRISHSDIEDLDLTVKESTDAKEDIQLQIREETVPLRHKNKWGEDYQEKY